jgi:hypothetical protein
MYEETIKDQFGDHRLAATYRSQLKTSTHSSYPAVPKDHVMREADRTFNSGVGDADI